MEKRRVLITGLGTVNPLGHNAADTWQAVRVQHRILSRIL